MNTKPDLDLDLMAPHLVPDVLRKAADAYRQGYAELASTWQDKTAGRVWERFAAALEVAAERCERILKDEGL